MKFECANTAKDGKTGSQESSLFKLMNEILRWCKDSDGISGIVESTPDLKSVGVGLNPTRSS